MTWNGIENGMKLSGKIKKYDFFKCRNWMAPCMNTIQKFRGTTLCKDHKGEQCFYTQALRFTKIEISQTNLTFQQPFFTLQS